MGRIYINPWIKDVPGLKLAFWIVLWSSVDVVLFNIKGDVCNEPHNCICTQPRVHCSFIEQHQKCFSATFRWRWGGKKRKEETTTLISIFICETKRSPCFWLGTYAWKYCRGGYVNTEYSGVGQNWLSFIGFNPLEIYLYRLSLQWKGTEWNCKTFNSNPQLTVILCIILFRHCFWC